MTEEKRVLLKAETEKAAQSQKTFINEGVEEDAVFFVEGGRDETVDKARLKSGQS